MSKRRSFIARMKTWHVVLGFIGLATVSGAAVLGTISTLETRYGMMAAWMGWATVTGVKTEISPLAGRLDRAFQWQLYETARRLTRNIDDLKERKNPTRLDQERLAELTEQLVEVKAEYAALKKKAVP